MPRYRPCPFRRENSRVPPWLHCDLSAVLLPFPASRQDFNPGRRCSFKRAGGVHEIGFANREKSRNRMRISHR